MKTKRTSHSAFFNPRALLGLALCLAGMVFAGAAITGAPKTSVPSAESKATADAQGRKPIELRATKASRVFDGDLRSLPYVAPKQIERPEPEPPTNPPRLYQPPGSTSSATQSHNPPARSVAAVNAPAPAPSIAFNGLDRTTWGSSNPPDTNGDVGPTYYIQIVNTSVGVYRKSDGQRVAAFTLDTLMSQGNFGNICGTHNSGDPIVVYDTFEDRWIITDFALDSQHTFQCFAVSQTGDPVTGGWNYYSTEIEGGLGDYPKFGIWTDGLYMSANMFGYGLGPYQNPRVYAFNKAQMYAGAASIQIVRFDADPNDFTLLPSNARLQTGTPPVGRPNLFVSTWLYTNALTVYKFHVDWTNTSLSSFTGPDIPASADTWNPFVDFAPQPGTANTIETLSREAMAQNHYTNIGGVESLWASHTVARADDSTFAVPRWYQVNVTGGIVDANLAQAATWDPDGADVTFRWMPSAAVDRAGDMAIGYTTSSSSAYPSIKYAGRLASDPPNTFSQTEQTLFVGSFSQTSTTRWGDYSAMTLDSDGCRFWYTNEYLNSDGTWLTKIGAFSFPVCTPLGNGGTISGTVLASSGGALSGATVALGSRSTTTDGSGHYTFSVPAGSYPTLTASFPGRNAASVNTIVVSDAQITTQDFSLTAAPTSGCVTDTAQQDFQTGVATNLDLTTIPGDVTLSDTPVIDQQYQSGSTGITSFGAATWNGQSFTPALSGTLVAAKVQLLCDSCGPTPPDLILSVRGTSGGLPTGGDLAVATLPGSAFASGQYTFYTASFGSPATLNSGTQYALILRPVSAPAGFGYYWTRNAPGQYAGGQRVFSSNSGATWSADSTSTSTSQPTSTRATCPPAHSFHRSKMLTPRPAPLRHGRPYHGTPPSRPVPMLSSRSRRVTTYLEHLTL